MYKKLQFHNHQNLGYVTLTQPLQKDYGTESTWLTIPEMLSESTGVFFCQIGWESWC